LSVASHLSLSVAPRLRSPPLGTDRHQHEAPLYRGKDPHEVPLYCERSLSLRDDTHEVPLYRISDLSFFLVDCCLIDNTTHERSLLRCLVAKTATTGRPVANTQQKRYDDPFGSLLDTANASGYEASRDTHALVLFPSEF